MESTTGIMDARPVVVRPQLRRAEVTVVDTAATSIQRGSAVSSTTSPDLEELWDRLGASAYTLACALLGDEVAAGEAVRLAMADLARTADGSTERAWSSLARHVYRHAEALDVRRPVAAQLPPVMVWVSRMARLQRASLALCVYGRLTHREAAALLDVPPATVAELLTAGLRELRSLAADHTRAEPQP